jgi:predicted MFS family arabinose efflux permease
MGLVYAIVGAQDAGWTSGRTVGLFGAALALLTAFVVIESRTAAPLVRLSIFRVRSLLTANVAMLLAMSGMFAMFFFNTLYLQNVLGYGPLGTGVRFLPLSVASFFVAAVTGNLISRVQVRWLLGVGLAVCGVALVLMSRVHAGSGWTVLLAGFLLGGIGIGLVNPSLASAAVGVVPPERSGMASGTNNTFRQVGLATGIAALGALFEGRISSELGSTLGHPPGHGLVARVASGSFPATLAVPSREAFVSGLHALLLVAAAVAFAGAVCCALLLRDFRAHQHVPAPAPATEHGGAER